MTLCKRIASAVLIVLVSTFAAAQPFPSKPIRIIVPYSPGGGADTTARILARRLTESLGQPVIVENRPGATGAIGEELVAKSPPDGYTLLFDASGMLITSILRKMPFDVLKDFTPVSMVVAMPMVLVVSPNAPYATLSEFIQYAKSNPRKATFANSGTGSGQHMTAELFASAAGLETVNVPYKGGMPALTDVMGGQVDSYFSSVAPATGPIKANKLRPLAVTTAKRLPTFPEVPTVAESGLTGFAVVEWNAVFVPAKTPEPIVNQLGAAIASAMRDPEVRSSLEQLGLEAVGNSPAEFATFVRAEHARWSDLVKKNKIVIE